MYTEGRPGGGAPTQGECGRWTTHSLNVLLPKNYADRTDTSSSLRPTSPHTSAATSFGHRSWKFRNTSLEVSSLTCLLGVCCVLCRTFMAAGDLDACGNQVVSCCFLLDQRQFYSSVIIGESRRSHGIMKTTMSPSISRPPSPLTPPPLYYFLMSQGHVLLHLSTTNTNLRHFSCWRHKQCSWRAPWRKEKTLLSGTSFKWSTLFTRFVAGMIYLTDFSKVERNFPFKSRI